MSQSPTRSLPNHAQIAAKLAQARVQLALFEHPAALPGVDVAIAAESHAEAAIHQMLQALDGALQGFNLEMPDPLPPSRVSRRNLRDRFHAVQAESEVIQAVEAVGREAGSWLWRLDRQEEGSRFAQLLRHDGAPRFWRDPLDPGAGVIDEEPAVYLARMLSDVESLIERVEAAAPDDVVRYRQALESQARRLM